MTYTEREIILAFAKNNMNARATARDLFYHTNTVYKRLVKIKEKYGLDPCNFYDLIKMVYIASGNKTGTNSTEDFFKL